MSNALKPVFLATAALALGLTACTDGAAPSAPAHSPAPASAPEYMSAGQGFPFSSAVRAGNVLYLSGQIGTNSEGRLVEGGWEAESRQTLDNIVAILEANGATLDDVFKCTVMLTDMSLWPNFNQVYLEYFSNPDRLPARSALGSNGLALGAFVEVECWAWSPSAG